ncbi:MAG: ABC transporter substrate-binding protein [Candidatus Weimeria sp.]
MKSTNSPDYDEVLIGKENVMPKVGLIFKRIITGVTACALMISATACGAGKNADSGETVVSASGEAEAATSDYQAKDLGGRTIKIGVWWDEMPSWTDGDKAEKLKEVEKKWNCKIEWDNLGWDGIIDSINKSIPSGKPDCDIYLSDPQFGIPAASKGLAMKISDYAPENADVLNKHKVFTPLTVKGNSDYLFYLSSTIPQAATYMIYNATMVKNAGLEYPEELAQKGEWTWSKFEEYAKKLTNGKVYGYGSSFPWTAAGFLASNNAELTTSEKEGLSSDASKETFEFLKELYDKGYMYPGDATSDEDKYRQLIFNGDVCFAFSQPWLIQNYVGKTDFDIRVTIAPTGPDGDQSMTPAATNNSYFIPEGCEDPQSVYELFEELNSWFDGDISVRDDPSTFNGDFVDENQIALANKTGVLANSDYWLSLDGKGAVKQVYLDSVIGKSSVSKSVKKNKSILQKELDDLNLK